MGLLIGMDEAGYGPNLGPLVVTVTVWEVPGSPRDFDVWAAMAKVAQPTLSKELLKLHVADSKQVYSPGKGIAALEKSVLSALRMLGRAPNSLAELMQDLKFEISNAQSEISNSKSEISIPPWLVDRELTLPREIDRSLIGDIATQWMECCRRTGVKLLAINSAIVQPQRFNALVRA